MALLGAILLAIFVVPFPWSLAVVAAGIAVEVGEAGAMVWWSRRKRAVVGAPALVGERAVVLEDGWVRVRGERWRARGAETARPGASVEVVAVEGLTLLVREDAGGV